MVKALAGIACLGLLVVACGSSHSGPGTLQRYQSIAEGLDDVTSATATVARDLRALNGRMRVTNIPGTRTCAGRLRWHATLLGSRAGRQAANVRAIARTEQDRTRSHYFAMVLKVLSHEWSEAQDLVRLAILAWWDPTVTAPGHVKRLKHFDGDARWHAWRSLELSRAAQAWRSGHPRSFRYVVVKSATVVASGG